ncbi:hypothetical protein Dda_8753 [Drechslerella dactyloides]|uniref:Uncharacterized protein n=1 Tax=Drechslerella dactyloides TaxID=74499 RepID=A0AAD6NHL0_DREDA|nr:hypothetical protein Dda_8753 [Drechslerella dactyloides]
MSSRSTPGGRPVVLTLPCGPPSAASSAYAASEASTETTSTASFASYNSTSTIGASAFDVDLASDQPSHSSLLHQHSPHTAGAPLPLLQLQDGDTLIYLNHPSSKFAPNNVSPPLRVFSSNLTSSNSPVFQQLLAPSMQQRIFNRLIKQKKPQLVGGKLPAGIRFVLDLTPEDEGDKAVEWQEKLWCPDVVLQWKSNLVDESPPLYIYEAQQQLEEFRQAQWGTAKSTGDSHTALEPYTFGRHISTLERLIHILHGIDPLIQTTVDWYTLHCLSVAFGTTDATRDYIARWIFANSLMIESHPSFIWQVAIEAGLATIASDAFAAAVMKYSNDPQEATNIPGALDAAVAFITRVEKEFQDLFGLEWVDQYLPPISPETSPLDYYNFDCFRKALRNYITRQMEFTGGFDGINPKQTTMRSTWLGLQNAIFCGDSSFFSAMSLDQSAWNYLTSATQYWQLWEASSPVGAAAGNDDLWADVRLGAPRRPVASVTQNTAAEDDNAMFAGDIEDAQSEMTSMNDAEIIYTRASNDEMKVDVEHVTENIEAGPSKESVIKPEPASSSFLAKLDDSLASLENKPTDWWTGWREANSNTLSRQTITSQTGFDNQATTRYSTEGGDATEGSYEQPSTPLYPKSDPAVPVWLVRDLAVLSHGQNPAYFWALMHHPQNDITRSPEPRIRCLDCPDMLYFPGPGESLENFKVHLRNHRHLNRVQQRQLQEARQSVSTTNSSGDNLHSRQNDTKPALFDTLQRTIEIPNGMLSILRLCETYLKSKCAEMTARNIVFEPILLEESLACLEESERAFMPLWSGGEAAPNANFSKTAIPNRGVSDSAVDEGMTINISSAGVGSVCTASTFASSESFTELNTLEESEGSGSVISLEDNDDMNSEPSNIALSSAENADDWVMGEDDDDDEIDEFEDDDIYFQ